VWVFICFFSAFCKGELQSGSSLEMRDGNWLARSRTAADMAVRPGLVMRQRPVGGILAMSVITVQNAGDIAAVAPGKGECPSSEASPRVWRGYLRRTRAGCGLRCVPGRRANSHGFWKQRRHSWVGQGKETPSSRQRSASSPIPILELPVITGDLGRRVWLLLVNLNTYLLTPSPAGGRAEQPTLVQYRRVSFSGIILFSASP
jgi:hypothetical protein